MDRRKLSKVKIVFIVIFLHLRYDGKIPPTSEVDSGKEMLSTTQMHTSSTLIYEKAHFDKSISFSYNSNYF